MAKHKSRVDLKMTNRLSRETNHSWAEVLSVKLSKSMNTVVLGVSIKTRILRRYR